MKVAHSMDGVDAIIIDYPHDRSWDVVYLRRYGVRVSKEHIVPKRMSREERRRLIDRLYEELTASESAR